MKYIIIGAGVSGLTIGHLLSKDNEVVIFEKDSRPGGMIKCDRIDGNLFHRTGGHVFNTKRQDVLNWFWSFFDREKEFTKALRNSSVVMPDDKFIPYPIENHVFMLDKQIGEKICRDLVKMAKLESDKSESFEDFLQKRFGQTLYDIYFKPYNWKVWRRDLSQVPLSWLEGKLPMPSVEDIIFNNLYHVEERDFVHSSFFYPKKDGSQFIADKLAKNLNIRYGENITSISYTNNKWKVNGEIADRIVFCGNIKTLPAILQDKSLLTQYADALDRLESHGTTSVFCKIDNNPYSWVYQPSKAHLSHRIICTGNFAKSNNKPGEMTATIEFTDEISKEEIIRQLELMPFSPKYITHNYEKYTYPIQDKDTRSLISSIKESVEPMGLYLCGRFAEWEYANMDICMGFALDLFNKKLK